MFALFLTLFVLVCMILMVVVLLQSSKGGGLAGAFGGAGGAPQQLLGSRGMTTLLHKLTVYLAVGFFVTSFMLFMTQDTGAPRPSGSGVVGEAARSGDIETPITNTPLETPAETPAGEESTTPVEGEGTGTESTDDGQ